MATIYPKTIQFLLADAVRQEQGGKVTVLGLYSGDSVVLQDVLPKEFPEGMNGLALACLTILAIVRDGQGRFDCNLHLFGPTGTELGKGLNSVILDKQKDAPVNLIFPIQPFPIPDFGNYRIALWINKHEYEFKFKVTHADPGVVLPKVRKGEKPVLSKGKGMQGNSTRPVKPKTTLRK